MFSNLAIDGDGNVNYDGECIICLCTSSAKLLGSLLWDVCYLARVSHVVV